MEESHLMSGVKVFKKWWLDQNCLDIIEYKVKIHQLELRQEHSTKFIYTRRYKFVTGTVSGLDAVEEI